MKKGINKKSKRVEVLNREVMNGICKGKKTNCLLYFMTFVYIFIASFSYGASVDTNASNNINSCQFNRIIRGWR
jgi:hypothetical protein